MLRRPGVSQAHLGIAVELVAGRAAGDKQFRSWHPGNGLDDGVVALARDQPAQRQHPHGGTRPGGTWTRVEAIAVHPARDYVHGLCPGAVGGELGHLVGAGCDDRAGPLGDRSLDAGALRRTGVGFGLVAPFHVAQRVKRLYHGHGAVTRRADGGDAAHPEVGVRHVRRLPAPAHSQPAREGRHVAQQIILGQRPGWPGRDVAHGNSGREALRVRPVRGVAAGEHGDVMTAAAERGSERGHMHVLAARVGAPQRRERAGMLRNHVDFHVAPVRPDEAVLTCLGRVAETWQ